MINDLLKPPLLRAKIETPTFNIPEFLKEPRPYSCDIPFLLLVPDISGRNQNMEFPT
jgi:hypothetical protein